MIFFIFFSSMVYYRILNIVPRDTQYELVVCTSYIYQFASANPKLPTHPSPSLVTASSLFSMSTILFLFHR